MLLWSVFILLSDSYSDAYRRKRSKMKSMKMNVTSKLYPAKYPNCKRKKFEI
jgi:hypothetical protein